MTTHCKTSWPISRALLSSALVASALMIGTAAASPVSAESIWPGLRGPNHDGSVEAELFKGESVALELGWKVGLGSGYSAVVVADGRVFTQFADGDADYLGAFDTESGAEIWRYRFADTYKGHDGSHDGPISTPWIEGDTVFGLGPYGELFALSVSDGKERWTTHLNKDHGAPKPHYGFTSSPVVADGVVVLQLGGGEGKSVAGFNAADGELLWTVGDDKIDYQSPVLVELGGVRQVISAGPGAVLGIAPADGTVLWSFEHGGDGSAMGGGSIIPVPAGDDRIFLAHQFEASTMLQVKKDGDAWQVEALWSSDTLKRSYVQPVVHDGYVYGISGRILTCIDAATGERKWRSRAPGDGFPTRVGDHLVIITKPGSLHVADASPEGYSELASLDLFEDHSWSAVAFAEGRLFARSMGHLARVDVTGTGSERAAAEAPSWVAGTAFGAFLDKVAAADDKKAVVDGFLAEQSSFPIVEPSGAVHFLYRGEAEDVGIVGDMIGFRREDPMSRVPGTDLFYYSAYLEPDAAVAYGFLPDYAGEAVPDPRNGQGEVGLFGPVSWFSMPAYRSADYLGEAAEARRGKLETVEWESPTYEGKKQTVQVYLPAGYGNGDARYPVVYVQNGKEALEAGSYQAALDNLIGDSVAPLIAVFIDPPAGPRRGPDPNYPKMLTEEIVPKIDSTYRTVAGRMGRAAVGAGGGADVAYTVSFNFPDLFGKVGGQGLSLLDPNVLTSIVPSAAERPYVLYQEWGTYHLRSPHEAWDMAESNRAIRVDLREKGYRPAGGEVPEGYGWQCWRNRTDAMLSALFPNPG